MIRKAAAGALIVATVLGWAHAAKQAEAQYTGPKFKKCFDRCMTRCHLPKGYPLCRDDCRAYCGSYRRPYGG